MRKLPAVLAVAALTLLSGCTYASEHLDDVASPSGSTSAPTFDPSTITKDDALAALVPQEIRENGVLRVGTNPAYAPAEYLANDGRTQIGYDMDIIRAVANRLGLKLSVQSAEFTSIIPGLGPKYDAGISSFTITPEREKSVNMVSVFVAGEAYGVPKGNPEGIKADDICGKKVAVETGTTEDDETKNVNQKCLDQGKKPIQVLRYPSQADATTNVVGGKADILYADSPIVAYAVTQTNGALEQLGDVFESSPQAIVVAKEDTQLATAIQKSVQSLIDDGSYGKILAAWNVSEGAIKTSELNP